MVYCPKCGTKNKGDAQFCGKCGKQLSGPSKAVAKPPRDGCFGPAERRERQPEECFGAPRLGAMVGIAIGLLVVLFGVGVIFSRLYRAPIEIWPLAVVILGIMIVAAALAALGRRSKAR